MERTIETDPTTLEPFDQDSLRERRKQLHSLLGVTKAHNRNVLFRVLYREPLSMAISIVGINGGITLFFATSIDAIEPLRKDGVVLEENETDMILRNPEAHIWEVNKRLPRFLKRWYPELAGALPKERQRIATGAKKVRSA